jgi:type II secretory pathway predicted ATPase ExeA
MIEKHWKLTAKPFSNTPDPSYIYHSPTFDEGFARLLYDVTELRGGLSLVTGDIGCGKTMLANALVDRLRGTPHEVTVLVSPRLTAVQLLRSLATSLGMEKPPRAKHTLIAALGAHLAELHDAGRRPVLLVDEAQLVTPVLLEEIRLLTNFESRTDKHLHVVLLGQPELRDRIAKQPQIDQRISLRYHLPPLESEEVGEYVKHRLSVAGANGKKIFDEESFPVLAERTGGVPRLVNNLATQALFVGALRGAKTIDAELVNDVADDRE